MTVNEITDYKSNKVKIKLDNGIAFVLYKGDLPKYDIKTGELSEEVFDEIWNELLPKRALSRSLKIITGRDMTEWMLAKKLEEDGYPDEIITNVISRLRNERLLDDTRFIRGFIEAKSLKKSKRDIMIALSAKGIDVHTAERIFDEMSEEGEVSDECDLIRKLLIKRHYDFENSDYETKQKEIQYLLRKGFSMDSVKKTMNDDFE